MTNKNRELNEMVLEMSNSDSSHQNTKKLYDLHKNNEELQDKLIKLIEENDGLKRKQEEMNSYSFMQTNP
jgi:hypothetical protein